MLVIRIAAITLLGWPCLQKCVVKFDLKLEGKELVKFKGETFLPAGKHKIGANFGANLGENSGKIV